MSNIIQHSKQYSNGAPVVTPDRFAVKARVKRLKRVMRDVKRSYDVERVERNKRKDEVSSIKHTALGLVCGIVYCSMLLFIPL